VSATWRALAASVLLALCAAAAAADPRVERAGALLAHEETWPEAIALYREALAADPELRDARLQLARVLSWSKQFDASVAEYDALLERWPGDLEARIGRAEVLSWAGRNAEATAAFAAILQADPGSARAQRGLARVQRWSGDLARADASYRIALDLEDDAAARSEWDQMRSGLHSRADASAHFFADNDDFDRYDLEARARRPFGFATEAGARLVRTSVNGRNLKPNSLGDDDGYTLEALLERKLGPRWRIGGGAGLQTWVESSDLFVGHLDLGFSPDSATSLGLGVEHGSMLDLSGSLQSVRKGLEQTGFSASAWRDLGGGFDLWTRGQLHLISDGNLRESAELSLGVLPLRPQRLRVTLSGSFLRYEHRSEELINGVETSLYYDPDLDLTGRLGLAYRIKLGSHLELGGAASAGVAYTKTSSAGGASASDVGPIGGVEGNASYELGSWRFSAQGAYSGTLRASRYRGIFAGGQIERSF
jgi:tetratricopeptide (TPR) repeat protein